MLKDDVKIGMKVIPYSKTVKDYEGLENSSHWKGAISINQYYLFVTDWHENTNVFSLGIEINDSGDFFNASDFEPYIKTKPLFAKPYTDEDKNIIIETEMRQYYGSRYYDEYACNSVTSGEFNKLRELIFTCIEKCR